MSLTIRKRKLYATRHTFITGMVNKTSILKKIADYAPSAGCGEKHYCAISEPDPDEGYQEVFEKSPAKSSNNLASPDRLN